MNSQETDPLSGEHLAQLMSWRSLIGPGLRPVVWSFEPQWIKVNSNGKANLDILSPVKYGEGLLNEQLIPRRYHVPAKTRKRNKISFYATRVLSYPGFPLCRRRLIACE